jgi:3-hydroxyisobutyrate dehydrogenase-like beta-hydroxyacid dehydrogenase
MSTVAFLGLGAMGGRMAERLLAAGHQLRVWNRTPARSEALAARGATAARSPAEAAAGAEVAITMVTDRDALEEVVAGPDGLAAGLADGATHIEMSTVGPDAVRALPAMLPEGVGVLDAPVLGSLSEAEAGSLRIFVGGEAAVVERWTGLLEALGTPMHVGQLGSGAAAKLVANGSLFGVLGVLGESLALADGLGLSRDTAFEVLAGTPLSAQAERRRPVLEDPEPPTRFALSLARKDADLVVEAAAQAGLELPLATAARDWLARAEADGLGERDYSLVLRKILDAQP